MRLIFFLENMSSSGDSFAMMQIDCEVTDTRLLHIHKSAIPSDTNTTHFAPSPPPRDPQPQTAPASKRNNVTRRHRSAHLPREPDS